jgi:predicted unusual protein kinase regulating ubiquinone biosynthesis (AarF/ABC1/UbiB family)
MFSLLSKINIFYSKICKIYNQIKKIYYIKSHIDTIYKTFNTNDEELQLQSFQSLKKLIFDSGSLYIKFFQWYISKLKSNTINNNTPESLHIIKFINFFEDIFEQCPYHDLEHTKYIFKKSMNDTEIDNYIDMETFTIIASGSIGQVYYGCRKQDGLEVAIKVKHPNIEKDLDNQIELIRLIKFIQSITYFRHKYNLLFNIDDFLEDINLQCNFNNEANNTKLFIENFKDSSNYIVFPEVLYQSNDLIISKYIKGSSVDTLTDMQKFHTSINFICFFKQMLFVDNFIHGDLHCKNWKVRYNEITKTTQIIVYDCGICFKNINTELTSKLWYALINYDINTLIILLKDFIKESNDINIDYFNNNIFDNEIKYLFNHIIEQSMGTSLLMKILLNLFKINNLIVHKFLLNFTILICVIEEYMQKNNLINKNMNKNINMFDIINDNQLDIISFCEVKKCYPKVKEIIELNMKDSFITYKTNSKNNSKNNSVTNNITITDTDNITDNITDINDNKKLFSSISLSKLKFKPPE